MRSSIQRRRLDAVCRAVLPVSAPELPAPAGLCVSRVDLDSDEYLVISFPTPDWTLPDSLSTAEREIALAILQGASNETIAQERHSSIRTVANQIASIFEKVGVSSRIELAIAVSPKRGH